MHGSHGALAAEGYALNALSSRADAVSGKDVLVELIAPAATSAVRVLLNGREVTAAFRPTIDRSRLVGLVGDLQFGRNIIEARIGDGAVARLDIVDHPLEGPIFSGPHQTPFACQTDRNGLGEPQDRDCSAQTIISYYYKQQTGALANIPNRNPVKGFSAPFGGSYGAGFRSYDPSKPHPADIAQTTTSDGKTVDYIVREEIGTINRAVYEIQFLYQPGTPLPTPWTAPTPGWNGRLVYFFGGGCQPGYSQATLTNNPAFAGGFPAELLSQGYAIATSSLNMFGNNCNDRISAETLSMVKEHFIKTFGIPVHTIGSGASGGSMQQHLIAQNYPGLLDGIIPALSFPDITSIITPVVDCSLLENAFKHANESWSDEQKSVVSGFATWKTCATHWIGRENFSPGWVTAGNCPSTIPKQAVYDRARNPSGIRCDLYDNEVNVYGRDPSTHFARRPLDNSGVQYGLMAFNARKISAEQFVELNEKIGGFDADGIIVPFRSSADREALRLAYRDGLVNTGGGGLGSVPIIDVRAYMDDSGDFHDSFRSFATRTRLAAANGTASNQVILMAAPTELESALLDSAAPYRQITVNAVLQMDRWLDAISRDGSAAPLSQKIVKDKPADLVDTCWSSTGEKIAEPGTFESTGRCGRLYPIHGDPRIAAGAPLTDDVLKCALKPLSANDYGRRLSAAQTSRLKMVFPQGVCDWSRPGVGQQVTRAAWTASLAQNPEVDRVVLVRNGNSPISLAIANDYARRRGVRNVLTVICQDDARDAEFETIDFTSFQSCLEKPLRSFLRQHSGIDFIVLTKGIPIRLKGAGQGNGSEWFSLDSHLAALDYEKIPDAVRVDIDDPEYRAKFIAEYHRTFRAQAWANRYWNSMEPFTHAKFGGYLVTRLDGYTEADAKALTTRALQAEQAARDGKKVPKGEILLNTTPWAGYTDKARQPVSILPPGRAKGENAKIVSEKEHLGDLNSDIQLAADLIRARGLPVELEEGGHFVGNRSGLMGYLSWGSNDASYSAAAYHSLTFAPGAIAETAVSTGGRTFLPTTGGQSLVVDLISQGVTGIKGYSDEPLVQAVAAPSILFDRYTRGWTLAESFYAASALVGWQDIVIGDPLARAYPVRLK